MDERQIGLSLALKEVGVSSEVVEFDSRLIVQKAVYLLEEAGIRLGYSYNWYLRGPYSPTLTRDLFEMASSNEDAAGWVLDDASKTIARKLKPLFDALPSDGLSAKGRRLELLASLQYLARRRRLNVDDVKAATEQLAKNGKQFPDTDVADAIRALKGVQLL